MKAIRAKLFPLGGCQAVRLPGERFPEGQREVSVQREGSRVVLESVDEWPESFRACLGAWEEKIPRPPQSRLVDLADPRV
jgi:virulence-associated protein VagC